MNIDFKVFSNGPSNNDHCKQQPKNPQTGENLGNDYRGVMPLFAMSYAQKLGIWIRCHGKDDRNR